MPTAQPVTKRTEALHQRKSTIFVSEWDSDDLGTSHSTRYNTSADFNSVEPSTLTDAKRNSTKLVQFIKTPSKIYEPPFVYPIYNQDEVQPATETLRTSSAAPFSTASSTVRFTGVAAPAAGQAVGAPTTTPRPASRPTTFAGLPFSFTTQATAVSSTPSYRPAAAASFNRVENRTPTPAQSFRLATPTSTTAAPKLQPKSELPFNDLLPPFVDFVPHDIATTQGPPIYYEWKVPANGLEPPKLDPPIGVDGREYPETTGDYKQDSKLNDIASHGATSKRLPISRSIKTNELPAATEKAQRRSDLVTASSTSTSTDITQLRKQLLIPEYAFPLETIGRTGYAPGGDLYNSFQLKIPERRSSTNSGNSATATSKGRWFGENPKCPECHPSFVLPGTCEPCLRR